MPSRCVLELYFLPLSARSREIRESENLSLALRFFGANMPLWWNFGCLARRPGSPAPIEVWPVPQMSRVEKRGGGVYSLSKGGGLKLIPSDKLAMLQLHGHTAKSVPRRDATGDLSRSSR